MIATGVFEGLFLVDLLFLEAGLLHRYIPMPRGKHSECIPLLLKNELLLSECLCCKRWFYFSSIEPILSPYTLAYSIFSVYCCC